MVVAAHTTACGAGRNVAQARHTTTDRVKLDSIWRLSQRTFIKLYIASEVRIEAAGMRIHLEPPEVICFHSLREKRFSKDTVNLRR